MSNPTHEIKPDPIKAAFSQYVAGLLIELFDRPDAADVITKWERHEILFMISPRGLAAVPATEPPAADTDPAPVPGNYL